MKAAKFWRRIEKHDRADSAEEKAIQAIADPLKRGMALLRTGDFHRANETFATAGLREWSVRAQALHCQKSNQWSEAAELWQSINDTVHHAAAMAQIARSREDWKTAAGWHHVAGQKGLAAQAERVARSKHAAETAKILREQVSPF
jgi:hypothetical protein